MAVETKITLSDLLIAGLRPDIIQCGHSWYAYMIQGGVRELIAGPVDSPELAAQAILDIYKGGIKW